MKYIALLRGINVGGKNRVLMADLRACFENAGFTNVVTYINSGNVIFETNDGNDAALVQKCERAIEQQFGFHVICAVLAAHELQDAMAHAPTWWNQDPTAKNNAIFVIAPTTAQQLMEEIGDAKPEYEQVAGYGQVIFWAAPLKTFSRTRYSNVVTSRAYQQITIRNANTANKLAELCA